MPVRKFRDVSEMEGTVWFERGAPSLFAAIAGAWDFAQRTLRPRSPPGVHKHRSAADAAAQRERWDTASFEAHQRRIRSRGGGRHRP